ncbi:e58c3aac-0ac6-4d39-b73b-3b98f49919ab [Sclerotinia trifoliorum]|uniref:E58c3aac-0ac6-4d39-b73b-3b98f49919ab n=1 Tax=Sclerotinia trifoliorum TaxID=28548 RepID=A0A8H2VR46_9HELO|nr:e58c3aac-0ac6-4d39-b73b-3b98f49919ab [Sclerotinia trifoliorum]
MASHAALGSAAIDKKEYPAAITHLTKAIAENPASPNYFILRSTAYQRAKNHEAALADADAAVNAAVARSRRELIATAQFRRAVALHGLGRFGDARLCLNWCRQKNEKEKGLTLWQAKVKADYDNAGGEEAECNKCTVKEIPEKQVAKVEKGKELEKSAVASAAPVPAAATTPKEKIRHEWFQSSSKVTITIFAKGVAKDTAQITIEEGQVEVSFPIGETGTTYDFTASPLYAQIDPAQSKFTITPNKVEIDLQKSKQGLKWSSLEGTEPIIGTSTEEKKSEIPAAVLNPSVGKAPSYPTSSRNGPKDWDALASSALESEKKEGGKETTGDDDDESGDPMDAFFKKLYKDADPDTKRAMMKSFQESNGTALSTNWSDVKKGTVETNPPEGVEAKKW